MKKLHSTNSANFFTKKRSLFSVALLFAPLVSATSSMSAPLPPTGTALTTSQEMQRETEQFNRISPLLPIKDDCVPVRVGGVGRIDYQYLACSDVAYENDGKSVAISQNLEVPEGLARRFNFWRRVYSLWSKNQYVMHIAEFPEVVLEIHDSSRIKDLGDKAREKLMKPWIDLRRREYQQVLTKLGRMKEINVEALSPLEKRIYKSFEHIERKDKFAVAASAIRVQRGQREYIETGLAVSPRYLPYIEQAFQKEGLIPEFARIAFIESSFNLMAMSKVGASGVYQIMPETGRDYLILEQGIDERNDPIKASRAAAKLLMMNYRILGSWPLAITAYNHGVGGIRKAMQATGSSDIITLINSYDGPNFGFASKNFYAGFLGLLATLEKSSKIFPEVPHVEPLSFSTVRVAGMTVGQVKSKYKLTSAGIIYLNPDIHRTFVRNDENVFPARYVLKIPAKPQSNPAINLVNDVKQNK